MWTCFVNCETLHENYVLIKCYKVSGAYGALTPGPPCFLLRSSECLKMREGPRYRASLWPQAWPLEYSSEPPGLLKLSSLFISTWRGSVFPGPSVLRPTGRELKAWRRKGCSVSGLRDTRGRSRGTKQEARRERVRGPRLCPHGVAWIVTAKSAHLFTLFTWGPTFR